MASFSIVPSWIKGKALQIHCLQLTRLRGMIPGTCVACNVASQHMTLLETLCNDTLPWGPRMVLYRSRAVIKVLIPWRPLRVASAMMVFSLPVPFLPICTCKIEVGLWALIFVLLLWNTLNQYIAVTLLSSGLGSSWCQMQHFFAPPAFTGKLVRVSWWQPFSTLHVVAAGLVLQSLGLQIAASTLAWNTI